MQKRIILLCLIGMFMISLSSAYTTNETKYGATFLITNDTFEDFRDTLFLNHTECYGGDSNTTFANKTRQLNMRCHIEYNGTEPISWQHFTLNFDDQISPLINITHPLIVQNNNTNITWKDFSVNTNSGGWALSGAGSSQIPIIGMPYHDYIGTCNEDAPNGAGLNTNYGSSTNFTMIGGTFLTTGYLENGTKIGYGGEMFLCNGWLYDTAFINTQFNGVGYLYGGGFGGFTSSNSFIESSITRISRMDEPIHAGGFTIANSVDETYSHAESNFGFVPTGSIATGIFRDGLFRTSGNNGLSFGFASRTNFQFIDCVSDSYSSSGFLATWTVLIKYTMKSEFRNSDGNLVNATYSLTDSTDYTYSNTSTSMDEEVITYTYSNGGNIDHNPFTVSIQNESYFNVNDFAITITTNNKGFLPMIDRIVNGYKYTMSSNKIFDLDSGSILG